MKLTDFQAGILRRLRGGAIYTTDEKGKPDVPARTWKAIWDLMRGGLIQWHPCGRAVMLTVEGHHALERWVSAPVFKVSVHNQKKFLPTSSAFWKAPPLRGGK